MRVPLEEHVRLVANEKPLRPETRALTRYLEALVRGEAPGFAGALPRGVPAYPVLRLVGRRHVFWHRVTELPPGLQIGFFGRSAVKVDASRPRQVFEGLARLLQVWPDGWKAVRPAPDWAPGAVDVVLALPPDGLDSDDPLIRQAVGLITRSPAVVPRKSRQEVAYAMHVDAHPGDPELAWLFWSCEALPREIGGFVVGYGRLDVRAAGGWAALFVEEDAGSPWLYVGELRVQGGLESSRDGSGSLPLGIRPRGPVRDAGQDRAALAAVLHAWPDGEKILALGPVRSGPVLCRPGIVACLGVRWPGGTLDDAARRIRAGLVAARSGVPVRELRSWMQGLSDRDVDGLLALDKLR